MKRAYFPLNVQVLSLLVVMPEEEKEESIKYYLKTRVTYCHFEVNILTNLHTIITQTNQSIRLTCPLSL